MFLAFRPFHCRKHRNDVIVTSYIKISQILKLKSKDITSKTLHAKFYASRIKTSELGGGGKYAPQWVWSVFKSPGKIGLNDREKGCCLVLCQTGLVSIRHPVLHLTLIYMGEEQICPPPRQFFVTARKRLAPDCWNFVTFIVSLLHIIWYTFWSPGT